MSEFEQLPPSEQVQVDRQAWWLSLAFLCLLVILLNIPNVIGAHKKAKVAQMKAAMHTLQLAVESYATDVPLEYPKSLSDFLPYLPGGGNKPGGVPGKLPSGVTIIEAPAVDPQNLRASDVFDKAGDAVVFAPSLDHHSYAIFACDHNGHPVVSNSGHALILSNQ